MAFNELIKSFDNIRQLMRDFYVFGFKSRADFADKSARSYDNERRRIESWLGDLRSGPDGAPGAAVADVQKRGVAWCAARSYTRTGSRLSGMLTALHIAPPSSLLEVDLLKRNT